MSEFSYRLSYGATAPKPYGSIPYGLLNTSNGMSQAHGRCRIEVTTSMLTRSACPIPETPPLSSRDYVSTACM